MLPIKICVITSLAAFAVGFTVGYSFRDDKAEVERLETVQAALKQENENLIKELEILHEYEKAAQATAEQTQEDLASLESRYADAIAELNYMQLQQLEYDSDDSSALSEDASVAKPVSQSTSKCTGADKAKFQRLYEKQLMISKDCDINSTYLNNLIDWYSSISNVQ